MRSKNQNKKHIFLVEGKYALGAILLLVLLYTLTADGRFASAKAGNRSQKAMPGQIENLPPIPEEKLASWDVIEMRVTAYCWCKKCCGKHSDGITASGHRIGIGDTFVAADKKYPFGTEMIIPGYNNSQPVTVLDRGGVIRGNKLDIFFNSHRRAKVWGVRFLPVKIKIR